MNAPMRDPRLSAPACRAATVEDASAMAELVDMAGEGLPTYLWAQMAAPGQSPWEVGRQRARRESGAFSYRNALMCEQDGQVVACMVGYPLADMPGPAHEDGTPAMFVPLQQLEDMVPGTWYVNVLATYPAHRGKGYGKRLLSHAEVAARDAGKRGLSIIVADTNVVARGLYGSLGFRERARRQMVKEGWRHPGRQWILLGKSL